MQKRFEDCYDGDVVHLIPIQNYDLSPGTHMSLDRQYIFHIRKGLN